MIEIYKNSELVTTSSVFSVSDTSDIGRQIVFEYNDPTNHKEDFSGNWYCKYNNEVFTLANFYPSVSKDNKNYPYKYTLVFVGIENKLHNFYFANVISDIEFGYRHNMYNFSFSGNLDDYVNRLRYNLSYHSIDNVLVNYDNSNISDDRKIVKFDNEYIWDSLNIIYKTFEIDFFFSYENGVTTINIGIDPPSANHIFEYGVNENKQIKGLTSISRTSSLDKLFTSALGVGSNRNVPYRYFKTELVSSLGLFTADPDNIPELKSTLFTNLLPSIFRDYVKGWRDASMSLSYQVDSNEYYSKGYNDYIDNNKFNPSLSIVSSTAERYGIIQSDIGVFEDIYPTIQGVIGDEGRIDEVIDVEEIVNDEYFYEDPDAVDDTEISLSVTTEHDGGMYSYKQSTSNSQYFLLNTPTLVLGTLKVPQFYGWGDVTAGYTSRCNILLYAINDNGKRVTVFSIVNPSPEDGDRQISVQLDEGRWRFELTLITNLYNPSRESFYFTVEILDFNIGYTQKYSHVFNIWIKDIGFDLTDSIYWTKDPMTVHFSDGQLAGEDYDFEVVNTINPNTNEIISYAIVEDTSKNFNGVNSRWRLKLKKSDAEFDATYKQIPSTYKNAVSGDHFYLTNIQLPHSYIVNAEKRLTEAIEEELSIHDEEELTYSIDLSRIFCSNFSQLDRVVRGGKINIKDSKLSSEMDDSFYITSVNVDYDKESIPKYSITISKTLIQ